VRNERKQQHDPAPENAETSSFRRVRLFVRGVDDHAQAIVDDASEHRPLHQRCCFGLQRALRGMRPERSEPTALRRERVDHAVVHPGRLGEMARDEITENSWLGRLGQIGRKAEEPAELAA
jgi:hypothetical protein